MASEATLTERSARIEASRHPAQHRRYRELKKKVEDAVGHLARTLRQPRSPEVRRAYADLEDAINRALKFVEGRVRLPYRGLIPPPAVQLDSFAATAWHGELEGLRDARERVRFTALDDPYYGIPAVRVATRAATTPDLQGLRTGEPEAIPATGEGMGIDFDAVVSEVSDRRQMSTAGRRLSPLVR